ncbi:hypothetical protein [Streptomyces fradiae]|uniref:hypothetical protein n=1 Tax=Streptomyces fradiae TaxID=1906 RepID=UPI003986E970
MIWWLRIRVLPFAAISLLAVMVLGGIGSSVVLPVPVLTGSVSFPLPVALALPMIPAWFLVHGQGRSDAATERVACRAIRRWDGGAVIAFAALAMTIGLVESKVLDWYSGIAMGRNFLGYLGLALVIRRVAGPAAATIGVSVFPFACASFGIGVGGRPDFWAWPLHASGSLVALTTVAVLFAAGLLQVGKTRAGAST